MVQLWRIPIDALPMHMLTLTSVDEILVLRYVNWLTSFSLAILWEHVTYWPSTELSIKRCTCINKRRNSRSRWVWDNYITRCHRRLGSVPVGVGVSWRQNAELRASGRQRTLGLQWPTVKQPSQDAKEVLLWSEELGVNI